MDRKQPDESVRCVPSVSYARFRSDFSRRSVPLVIRAFTAGWAAHERWSADYFLERFGDEVVSSERNEPTRLGDAVRDALESSDSDQRPYLSNVHIATQLPALLGDLEPMPDIVSRSYLTSRFMPPRWRDPHSFLQLYIGGRGSGFGTLHYDVLHARVHHPGSRHQGIHTDTARGCAPCLSAGRAAQPVLDTEYRAR